MGQLYIVSTPIGNLADFSFRAVDILGAVDRVLAEDTRRTTILLRHYGIDARLYSAHAHNEQARLDQILAWLDDGEKIALLSDAGTPLLSDPGSRIVRGVLSRGHEVIPVPGASSVLAALVASGLDIEPFTFMGFLARSGVERKASLGEIARRRHTTIVFEAPGRVLRLLRDLAAVCGANRSAVVARELTKLHETFVRGTLAELIAYYEGERVRGEIVLLIAGTEAAGEEGQGDVEARAQALARERLAQGESPRDIAKRITKEVGLPRNRAYEIAQASAAAGGIVE
ncbi:MAG: 16S rRNA (cytidine(1402)-2'-O)-methyltransferase [Longimicrobiales bacterium]